MEAVTRIVPCSATPHARERRTARQGASHPARLVAALFGVDAPSQFAARRGSKAGDAREVTCAASLGAEKGGTPKARAKDGPAQGRAWPQRAKIAQRKVSHAAPIYKSFKLSKNSNRASTTATPTLPRPESYRAGRGGPHPESFTSRRGRVILFRSHTVCPLQLKSLRAHETSTSPRRRSYPLGDRRASAKRGASSTSLAPPPTPGGQMAP